MPEERKPHLKLTLSLTYRQTGAAEGMKTTYRLTISKQL
jgi:hypothetical protein